MQPYFLPYAGYFRLFQSTDLFVAYDCIQFPRRGWVHRNQLPNHENELSWFTLPLTKAPQDISIAELKFSEDASARMQEQLRKFPIFNASSYLTSPFNPLLTNLTLAPVTYIVTLLKSICQTLQLPCQIARSSELNLTPDLKGQDRILAIATHFKASTYINAPGGQNLYDENHFRQHNIKLQFLADYKGPYQSVFPRIFNEDISALRNEIVSQSLGASL
jgi:hypothetical protein